MIDLGKHAAFIWASYGIVLVTLLVLIAYLALSGRATKRAIAELEARGIKRRARRD
ncbi:MAG: heme exporter protein CcmD [Pseudomonadota bacterium]